MKKILLTISLFYSISSGAQQDLKDPHYIYSLDNDRRATQARLTQASPDPGVAVILNGTLYKDINFGRFYKDSGLMYYHGAHYTIAGEISKFTPDTSIKHLFVMGQKK